MKYIFLFLAISWSGAVLHAQGTDTTTTTENKPNYFRRDL